MRSRSLGLAMAVMLGAAIAGSPMMAPSAHKPALASQQAAGPRKFRAVRLGGFLPPARKPYRTHGLRLTAAQQQRASLKRRNRARHKQRCRS